MRSEKRLRMVAEWAVILALGAAWTTPSSAQQPKITREGSSWVETVTGSTAAAKTVRISTQMGTVNVAGAAQPNITWRVRKRAFAGSEKAAQRQFESFNLRTVTRPEYVLLEGSAPEDSGGQRMQVEINVTVPKDTNLVKIETQGGSLGLSNLAGRVDANTMGGGIHLSDIGGPVVARTSGGGIEVSNAGSELKLETAGGSIRIHSANGRVYAQTAGGSIDLDAAQSAVLKTAGGCISAKRIEGELDASTAGGSVDVGDVAGTAILETAGGSIRLNSAKGLVRATTSGGGIRLNHLGQGAIAKTAAGPIVTEFVAEKGKFSDSLLQTSIGDVVVYLPPELPVTVKATIDGAMGHTIRSDFAELKITSEGGDYGPKEIYGEGAINGGGPLLKIRTTSGNIELRRGKR